MGVSVSRFGQCPPSNHRRLFTRRCDWPGWHRARATAGRGPNAYCSNHRDHPCRGYACRADGRSVYRYIAFLLGLRQRRSDGLLAAISGLDARGRVATMLLDFYTRLRRRKLTSGSTYNLPLSQVQIGDYLGLTVVHINRVLRSLRSERIVDLEKHCVTVLDLDRLVIMARKGGTASSRAICDEHGLKEAAAE